MYLCELFILHFCFKELCADNNLQDPEYILIRDIGPPHARVFTIRCKISNFEEDGIATTKKQAKHDAAKRMVDRIKDLVNSSSSYTETNEEDTLNRSITTIDTDLMNKNVEECYRALNRPTRKINLGIKLAEYHVHWRDSLEVDKRDKVLEQLKDIFPNEFLNNEFITNEILTEKISELETVLSEVEVKISMKNMTSDSCESPYFIKALELNTCPILTEIGIAKNDVEASWKALYQMIESIKLLLS